MAGIMGTHSSPGKGEMIKVGEKPSDEWYAGVPTGMGSATLGALGAFGYLGGPALGTLTTGLGSMAGGILGGFFEPDEEDVMVEKPLPPPQPYTYTPLQGSAIRGGGNSAPLPMIQQYGVEDPYGFGWG